VDNYKKVLLEPIEFWNKPDLSVSPDNQKMLSLVFLEFASTRPEEEFYIGESAGARVNRAGLDYQGGSRHARPEIFSCGLDVGPAIELRAWLVTRHAAFAGSHRRSNFA
jgi:hypothetical protein